MRMDSEDKFGRMSKLVGKCREAKLNLWELSQLQELWADYVPGFRAFLDRYSKTVNQGKHGQHYVDNIIHWCGGAMTEEEET